MKKITVLLILSALCTALPAGARQHSSLTPEAYEAQCRDDLKQFEKMFQEMEHISGPKTIESVLVPFNELDIRVGNSNRKAGLYSNVHPDAEIRERAKAHKRNISKLGSRIFMSSAIYTSLQEIPEPQSDPAARRLLNELLRDYRRSGVNQPEATRQQIRLLQEDLTTLGQTFTDNISSDVRSIELDSADELAGLPADYIDARPADKTGKIRITTNYPDYVPFMRYSLSDTRRRELFMLYINRGYPANQAVLTSILEKRFELANLLGYRNFAEFTAEPRMIKSTENIEAFIDQVAAMARPRAEREYAELLERLRKMDPEATAVDPWKAGLVSDTLRREKYEVDAKEVRSYFQFGHVRDGILQLTAELFGITYRRWDTDVWHPDVTAYEVLDHGTVIGRFYFDLHPRDNKFKHAAHFALKKGIKGHQLPESALVCNLPGYGNDAALMEHSQVEVFLHEFGHLLHHLFANQQRWSYFSGISTQRDFSEAPSQMLEEWIWNKQALNLISANKAGEPIPDELLSKMIAAKEFGKGLNVCGQMAYAAMSLAYYNCNPASLDLEKTMIAQHEKYSIYDHVPETHKYANFAHLYGYSAGYYTYMWSLVISKDLLSRFAAEGMLNPQTAREYRNTILAPGGSKDAADLVEGFLGRPYSFEPFGQWLNSNSDTP